MPVARQGTLREELWAGVGGVRKTLSDLRWVTIDRAVLGECVGAVSSSGQFVDFAPGALTKTGGFECCILFLNSNVAGM